MADFLFLAAAACFVVTGFLLAIWAGVLVLGVVFAVLGLAFVDGKGASWRQS